MAKVFLYDEFSPEDAAMMQALYSRSPKSVEEHAKKVAESGSGKFMASFYVGYGHASIADCGSTTLFIEGVSILADKAIQDWPLYSGQETSTRYIDMSKQALHDPIGTKVSQDILKRWMDFYISSGPIMEKFLKEKYPHKEGESEVVYEKAIKARSFDILRGFLPAGIATQLSWHTNLRQAWDKIALLRHHPLKEARDVAEDIWKKLKDRYPHSFSHELYDAQEEYRGDTLKKHTYFDPKKFPKKFSVTTTVVKSALTPFKEIFQKRPIKTSLPFLLRDLGTVTFSFLLDFGSFRDLQRHRASFYQMPLLTTKYGFHPWYVEELPADLQKKALQLIDRQTKTIQKLRASDEDKQYLIAMGFNVPCKFTFDLPALVYFIELRSGKLVHATIRPIVHKMHHELRRMFPIVKLHTDLEPSEWDVKRGLQDIVKK